jgi:hypothetical protein
MVGIGTSVPTAKLHVSSSDATGSLLIQNTTGSAHLFVNGSSGYVGVGMANPVAALDVRSATAGGGALMAVIGATTTQRFLFYDELDSSQGPKLYSNAAYPFVLGGEGHIILQPGAGSSVGVGTNVLTQKLTVNGSANISGNILYGGNITGYGADLAEYIAGEGVESGDVVVIDPENDLTVMKSETAFDTTVAGIVSTRPSSIMGAGEGNVLLALAGRVPVKVTNESGQIRRGDLLTTSSTPGHAMRCPGRGVCSGAVVGKALEEFNGNEGMITALVVLG